MNDETMKRALKGQIPGEMGQMLENDLDTLQLSYDDALELVDKIVKELDTVIEECYVFNQ